MKVTEDQLMTYDYCLKRKCWTFCMTLEHVVFWGVNFILFSLRIIPIERNDEK